MSPLCVSKSSVIVTCCLSNHNNNIWYIRLPYHVWKRLFCTAGKVLWLLQSFHLLCCYFFSVLGIWVYLQLVKLQRISGHGFLNPPKWHICNILSLAFGQSFMITTAENIANVLINRSLYVFHEADLKPGLWNYKI